MYRFVALDVETPNRLNSRMSAVGLTVISEGRITDSYGTLINPEQPFDLFNTRLTGIDSRAVAGAPTFPQAWAWMAPILGDSILLAHNAVFDLGVLRSCLRDYHIAWKPSVRYVCTVRMGRKLLPDMRHNLDVMCRHYGIPLRHHRADSDSQACAALLLRYLDEGAQVGDFIRTYSLMPAP